MLFARGTDHMPQRISAAALAFAMTSFVAGAASAQQYTVKQTGNLVELRDTRADMYVPVVTTVGRPWRIQVKGKDIVRVTGATPEAFEAGPGLGGMPPLFPFANRMDQTAFYANGQKYNFDTELGNVRGPIPSTGFVGGYKGWKLVEAKSDTTGAWVTCRLDFYKNPAFMQQWPFAHTVTVTYKVANGALEVRTRVDNMSEQPMPVVLGYHPIYELPEGTRDDWTVSIGARTHWIEIPQRLPTGETQPIEKFFEAPNDDIQLKNYGLIDDVFTDLIRDAQGRATMKLMGGGKEVVVMLGPKYKTVLAWSTALNAGGGGGGRGAAGGGRGAAPGGQGQGAAAAAGGRGGQAAGVRAGRRRSGAGRSHRAEGRAGHGARRGAGAGRPRQPRVHRLRADGCDHQRAQPRTQGRLQGTAVGRARSVLGRELLGDDERVLRNVEQSTSNREPHDEPAPTSVGPARGRVARLQDGTTPGIADRPRGRGYFSASAMAAAATGAISA
jgi:aldose 1-epimerase